MKTGVEILIYFSVLLIYNIYNTWKYQTSPLFILALNYKLLILKLPLNKSPQRWASGAFPLPSPGNRSLKIAGLILFIRGVCAVLAAPRSQPALGPQISPIPRPPPAGPQHLAKPYGWIITDRRTYCDKQNWKQRKLSYRRSLQSLRKKDKFYIILMTYFETLSIVLKATRILITVQLGYEPGNPGGVNRR